jgi:pimeloyl-ACP methyl ester carboxylesterase
MSMSSTPPLMLAADVTGTGPPLVCLHGFAATRARWRSTIVPPPAPGDARADAGARSPRRWTWARLLHRVFALKVLVCERGGGPRRILGAVTEPDAVRRVLVALGLGAEPPPGPVPAV